jgi:hypothetical protein
MCASSGADVCLLLEDDAEFTAREAYVLHSMLQGHLSSSEQLNSFPWDVLQLGLSPLSASYRAEEDVPHATAENPDRGVGTCGPETAAKVCRGQRATGRADVRLAEVEPDAAAAAAAARAEPDAGAGRVSRGAAARGEPRPGGGGLRTESAHAHGGPVDHRPDEAASHEAHAEAEAEAEAEAVGMRWVRKVRGSWGGGD